LSVWVTGDTHIPYDIKKLSSKMFPEGKGLKKDDYLIQLGDFGLLWSNKPDSTEKYWTKWLNEKPWTTLFIDGNHENHDRLNRLPEVEMFNGTVGKVSDSIYHLKRGQVYEICGKTFFTMGGALSIDKEHRTLGISWWREERPSHLEMDNAFENLDRYDNKVDFMISHTLPKSFMGEFKFPIWQGAKWHDYTCDFLEEIHQRIEYEKGYCGHWHRDVDVGKYKILYQTVEQIL